LREYSIPHLRKAGRISIPEDSFDRIREARDLHKEGLGTESVRRQLREDTGELDRRLDGLHQTLENMREDIRERPATDEVALSPTLRTILARQSLLMSTMFNLTEMVEDLLLANGKPRKPLSEDLRIGEALPEHRARDLPGLSEGIPSITYAVSAPVMDRVEQLPALRSTDFGTLGRRRRSVLAILAALLVVVFLAWATLTPIDAGNTESSIPRVAEMAGGPPGDPKTIAAPGGSQQEGEHQVPDVSGRSLEEAVRMISDAGFEVAAIKIRANQENPKTAIRTEPPSGAPARPGAPVILTISGGPAEASAGASSTAQGASVSASASASAGYAN